MSDSPQWRDGRFRNRLPRIDGPIHRAIGEFFFGGSPHRRPTAPIPVQRRTRDDFPTRAAPGARVTWLGHSTTIVELDGARLLVDPVWSERVSPFAFAGPKRFFPPPLAIDEIPPLDAIVLSHDHYDHLDESFVRSFATRDERWIVPLGVGGHLRRWGVRTTRIEEHDWWGSTSVGSLTLTATPARHFSGRSLFRRDRTLWCGWVLAGPAHRVYYAGDTAMQDEFTEIGARLGPFDLVIMEVGAYDAMWADVHIGPEQAVEAHLLARGGVLMPVHWGTFDLALHGWTEPIERTLAAAERAGIRVVTPRPGATVDLSALGAAERWWPETPWRSAEEAPIRSSGV